MYKTVDIRRAFDHPSTEATIIIQVEYLGWSYSLSSGVGFLGRLGHGESQNSCSSTINIVMEYSVDNHQDLVPFPAALFF